MPTDSGYVPNVYSFDLRQHVRLRPRMYMGGVDKRALHNLVVAMLDHAVEQAYLGRCNHIWIELHKENTLLLSDNSPGLPTSQYRDENITELEALMQLHMLRRDLRPRGHWMHTSTHEVGFGAVNALSEYFEVENYHDGAVWRQKYQYGLPITQLIGIRDASSKSKTGTRFVFRPDYSIFDANDFDRSLVTQFAHNIAKLLPGVIVELRDTRTDPVYETSFHYPEGLKTYVEKLNQGSKALHDVVHLRRNVKFFPSAYRNHMTMAEIEVAFQFSDGADAVLEGYANGWRTQGLHLAATKAALLSCINEYMNTQEVYAGHPNFTWNEISPGLSAAVSVYYTALSLAADDVDSVQNSELFGPIAGLVFESFSHKQDWAKSEIFDRIIEHHLSRR